VNIRITYSQSKQFSEKKQGFRLKINSESTFSKTSNNDYADLGFLDKAGKGWLRIFLAYERQQ
jgi:hypothetical protein